MSIEQYWKPKTYDKVKIDAQADSAVYYEALGRRNYVGQWGTRLKARTSGLNIYIDKGELFHFGRYARLEQEVSITVQPNTKGWIVSSVDLGLTNDSWGDANKEEYTWKVNQNTLVAKTSGIKTEDLNQGGLLNDFILYDYTSTNNSVTLVDRRPMTSPWYELQQSMATMKTDMATLTKSVNDLKTDNIALRKLIQANETGLVILGTSQQELEVRVTNLEKQRPNIHKGTTEPPASLGIEGDLYIVVNR